MAQPSVSEICEKLKVPNSMGVGLRTKSLLQLIRWEAPESWELSEVVGRWFWIQFDGKQPNQIAAALSEFGSVLLWCVSLPRFSP